MNKLEQQAERLLELIKDDKLDLVLEKLLEIEQTLNQVGYYDNTRD